MCFLPWSSNVVAALANGATAGVTVSCGSFRGLGGCCSFRGLQQKPGLPARSHLWFIFLPWSSNVVTALSNGATAGVTASCGSFRSLQQKLG